MLIISASKPALAIEEAADATLPVCAGSRLLPERRQQISSKIRFRIGSSSTWQKRANTFLADDALLSSAGRASGAYELEGQWTQVFGQLFLERYKTLCQGLHSWYCACETNEEAMFVSLFFLNVASSGHRQDQFV